MIRKSLLTVALLAVWSLVSAQSLQFELNGHVYADGEQVVCVEKNLMLGEIAQEFQIHNISGNTIKVVVMKEVLEPLEGVENSFCWGSCFGPMTFVSGPVPMEAGAVSGEGGFSVHAVFDPYFTGDPTQWIQGSTVVKYTAFDLDNEDDNVSLVVKFVSDLTSVDENHISLGNAYPNPASSMVRFDVNCEGSASLVLYNLVGREVMRQNVENGQVVLSVSDFEDGIYFCNLVVNGQVVKTEKFVVAK